MIGKENVGEEDGKQVVHQQQDGKKHAVEVGGLTDNVAGTCREGNGVFDDDD